MPAPHSLASSGEYGKGNEMDGKSSGLPAKGGPMFSSLEQLLSYNARGKPRAVFTRLSTGTNRALEGELGCFEFPLVQGARLQLGRFDPEKDGPGRKDKIVLSMADRRGLSRCHGSLECREDRSLVVWPVTEKEGFPTWVNGEPVGRCTKLCSGDWLGFGAISGRPVLEFELQLVNLDPGSKVLRPKANPGAPVPAHFGLGAISASPDPRSEQPASDNELSTDWSPKPDDEGRDKRPSRSSQNTLLERAQRQLAQMNQQSTVLERAQQQLAEMKLELQEKDVAHQKELSARTRMSSEAAELRDEIATLRGYLAEQAADQVFLSPPAYLGGSRAALFARQPSSLSSASQPATPAKDPSQPPPSSTSPGLAAQPPPTPPPRKLNLDATPPDAGSQSSRDANDLSGSKPAARRSSSGTSSPPSGGSPLSDPSSPSANEVRSITQTMNSPSAEDPAAHHTEGEAQVDWMERWWTNMRKLSWKQPAAQDEEEAAEAVDGLTRLLKDTQAHVRRVSDSQLVKDTQAHVRRVSDSQLVKDTQAHVRRVSDSQLVKDTQAHVRRVSEDIRRVSDSLVHLSDTGRVPSPTGSSSRLAGSPSPSRPTPRSCLELPQIKLDLGLACLGAPSRHAVEYQDVVSVRALDPVEVEALGQPTSTRAV